LACTLKLFPFDIFLPDCHEVSGGFVKKRKKANSWWTGGTEGGAGKQTLRRTYKIPYGGGDSRSKPDTNSNTPI